MSEIVSTRLRYVRAKNIDEIIEWISILPYKVEIKGNPVFQKSRWFLFFILPENPLMKDIGNVIIS